MERNDQETAPSPGRSFDGAGVLRITQLEMTKILKIGTWNVRTLYEAGKTHNLIREMKRLDIQILGVSETHWLGSGCFEIEDHTIYFSGAEDGPHQKGVAIICDKSTTKAVKAFVPLSERAMMIQLAAHPFDINVIQVYAPTADKDDVQLEDFYGQAESLLKTCRNHDVTFMIGDMNAKVGNGPTGTVAGPFGLGEQNDRGERLTQFCQEQQLIIMNTWFQLPKRRLYTWKAPSDSRELIVRNQIDYIMVKKRFRNAVKNVKTYPSADANTDHVLLAAKVKIRLKKVNTTSKQFINTLKLQQTEARQKVKESISHKLREISEQEIENNDVEESSTRFKNIILQSAEEVLGKRERKKKNAWITEEILELMDERREQKNKDEQKYREIQKKIKKAVKKAKEEYYLKSCEEIEGLIEKHDEFHLHKKLKETAGIYRPRKPYIMRNSDGDIILEEESMIKEWTNYIETLFEDERESVAVNEGEGLEILQSEVETAIKNAPTRKAPGPDGMIAELLKVLDEQSIRKLTRLYNKIYASGTIPEEWLRSKFITIPKKQKTKSCNDFRLISLMSHLLKVLLRIIQRRMAKKCEEKMSREQFGFRPGMGTREALYCLQVLLQKCREFRKKVFACFIDFEKAFDKVQHGKLAESLKRIGLDDWDIRLIVNLYWKQTAFVEIGNTESQQIPIKRGVRQGCVLSPMLFNIYSEEIFVEALEDQPVGVRIGGEIINNIRYADDTVLLAESMSDLQILLNRVSGTSEKYGLKINIGKTKMMIISKDGAENAQLELSGEHIERVQHFKYLGAWTNEDMNPDEEIKIRIALAKDAFSSWHKVLTSRDLCVQLRLKILKCYVWSRLLYGCETWTLKTVMMNRIEAFEMWCYRRMLKIAWTEKVRNTEILERIEKERELLTTIKKRKMQYLGHILRGPKYELLQTIMYGRIEGKRWIGRKNLSWLRNIRQWTNMSPEEIFHAARDREQWKRIVEMTTA